MKRMLSCGLLTAVLLCAASSSAVGEVAAPKAADPKGPKVTPMKKQAKAADIPPAPDAKGAEVKVVKKQAKAANVPAIGSSFPHVPNGESAKSAPKSEATR